MEAKGKASQLNKIRLIRLQKGKLSLWEYCKLTAPEFYKESRPHLKLLCETLQAFYEGRIIRDGLEWKVSEEYVLGAEVCNQLYVQMPPRHGKTRTITKCCEWILGNNNGYKFMYTSYNDDSASDTSRFIRDDISAKKISIHEYVFSDFFDAELQGDNKSVSKWALKGQYFNFISAGKGGSVTGKGCGIMGVIEGMMAGVMGGTMGAMITVMMFSDHVLWFMPFYMAINVAIVWGMSYMLYEEVVEDNEKTVPTPIDFTTISLGMVIVNFVLLGLMIFGPKSAFIGF